MVAAQPFRLYGSACIFRRYDICKVHFKISFLFFSFGRVLARKVMYSYVQSNVTLLAPNSSMFSVDREDMDSLYCGE